MEFQTARSINMRQHAQFNERWLQERIAEEPSLLGLGDLIVRDVERAQPHAGRLDLLLVDAESSTRYEVEIQLGASNEAHIIRTIEYWDIERRRYPQYEHVAVIVAEDITSRFLNVISLFNGFIPLMAVQIRCLELKGAVTLLATTVLDTLPLGTDEEDEPGGAADRDYWIKRRGNAPFLIIDQLFDLVRGADPSLSLNYTRGYIGLACHGVAHNVILFRPHKQHVLANFRISRDEELEARMEDTGLDVVRYSSSAGRYFIRLTAEEIVKQRDVLQELVRRAVDNN